MTTTSPSGSDQSPASFAGAGLRLTAVVRCAPPVLDLETAGAFGRMLAGIDGDTDVILDLSALVFCDSAGLRELVLAQQRLGASGGSLVLRDPPALLERLVHLCGLDDHLPIIWT